MQTLCTQMYILVFSWNSNYHFSLHECFYDNNKQNIFILNLELPPPSVITDRAWRYFPLEWMWRRGGVDADSYQVIELMLQADNINTLQGVKLSCTALPGEGTALPQTVMQYLEHLFKPEVYVNILTVGNNWLSFKLNKVQHWIIWNVGIRLSINKTNLLPPTLVAEFFLPITIMRGTVFRFSSGIGHNWHKIHHIIRFLC